MALFGRKKKTESVPIRRGAEMAVPDPHTYPSPTVPHAQDGGFTVTPGTYAVHQNLDTQDAGTAVQPQDLSAQRAIRKPTYWRGQPMPWLEMDETKELYTTRQYQEQGHRAPTFADMPGKPGTSPNPMPTRQQGTQSTYRAESPYDQRWARKLTGRHFSMASNIRAYPIGGQQPFHRLRNTWRMEPPPIDARMTDLPPDTVQSVENQNTVSRRVPFRRLF